MLLESKALLTLQHRRVVSDEPAHYSHQLSERRLWRIRSLGRAVSCLLSLLAARLTGYPFTTVVDIRSPVEGVFSLLWT